MTPPFRTPFVLLATVLACCAPAAAQDATVSMEGRCEKLIIAGQDITRNCKETLANTVSRNRTTFDFAAWDGQFVSFSGAGPQQERTEETDPLQPISLVVPGKRDKDGIVRNPAPAVGSCRFSTPEPGKTQIACEATSQGRTYAGTFVTATKTAPDGNEPSPAPK